MYGSVRSGKTEIEEYCALRAVKRLPPGNIQFIGKTLGSLERNVVVPMQQKFGNTHIQYNRSTKRIYVDGRECWAEGATNEGAVDRIQGESLVAAICDEVTTWPESFWSMLISRLSDAGAVLIGTMNPGPPTHFIKRHIDREGDLGIGLDGRKELRPWKFLIDENTFLDPAYVASIKKSYAPGSLWYRRFILSEWIAAEGAIYDMFDPDKHVIHDLPKAFSLVSVGVDYGTSNPTAFIAIGLANDGPYAGKWIAFKEHYFNSKGGRQKTDIELAEDMAEFLKGIDATYINIDPSAASFKLQLKRSGFNGVRDADNAVIDGIRNVASGLTSEKLLVHKSCENLIEETYGYVWDPKAQEKGEDKPIKTNDHALDALRYAFMRVAKLTVT